jgi:hypothetical protein
MVSVKTGLEKWGDKAKNALFDELNLFIKEKVFEQVVSPSNEQKKSALQVHFFMTKKRDGRIKARAVQWKITSTVFRRADIFSNS